MNNVSLPTPEAVLPGQKPPSTFGFLVSDESLNFHRRETTDRVLTGAQVAESVAAHPVTDFVVLQLLKSGELESLRPTETVDLSKDSPVRFFVIRGDRVYRFTVEGLSMEWPRGTIAVKDVKFLAGIAPEDTLLLFRDEGNLVLGSDDFVDLHSEGVEEIKIRRHVKKVTVYYGDEEEKFELEPRDYTVKELLDIFKVSEGYILDIIQPDGVFRDLDPKGRVCIEEGMKFSSHPPRGQSS